ncbi:MAG: PDDEXK nuclease domain-containing protein [Cyclobacteriaceae bacterium]
MPDTNPHSDFHQITLLIQEARQRAYAKVNEELMLLYYRIGKFVSEKVSQGNWGDKTVEELAGFIQEKLHGIRGFNRRGLYRMRQFYETYAPGSACIEFWKERQNRQPDTEGGMVLLKKEGKNSIVSSVLTQFENADKQYIAFVSSVLTRLSWTQHLMILSKTKTPEEKIFYLLTAITEKLSVRELERQLNSGLFERTVSGNRHITMIQKNLPEGIFKDPYIFEFLDLPELHYESDLEKALIFNLRKFILEIGKDFTYMGNQFRLQVGNKDYYTDLLFYHRGLQCLVMFELKIEEFKPEFLGKLNFYLEALDRNVKRTNENPSIGVLLCKGKETEIVEYALARNISPALIADYETRLIDKKILRKKLHELMESLDMPDEDL